MKRSFFYPFVQGSTRMMRKGAIRRRLQHIEARHMAEAVKRAHPIEAQVRAKDGAYFAGLARDVSSAPRSAESP